MDAQAHIADLHEEMAAKLREAYERGYRDGADAARERILKAASADAPQSPREQPAEHRSSKPAKSRVEKGAVRIAVRTVMASRPGQPLPEIAKRVFALDPRISSQSSVFNELTRNEGTHYERRAGLWYPTNPRPSERDQNAESPAAETARPSQ